MEVTKYGSMCANCYWRDTVPAPCAECSYDEEEDVIPDCWRNDDPEGEWK